MTDLDSFVNSLELAGHDVRVERHQAGVGENDIFGVRGHNVAFAGARVMAFEYRSERAAQRLQQSVNEDGDMIGSWVIDWGGQHLYRAGTLIVVYLGEKSSAIHTLESLLGTQFAPVLSA